MSNFSLYCDVPEGHQEYLIPMFSVPLLHLKVEEWDEKRKSLLDMYSRRRQESDKFKIATGSNSSLDVETDYHHNHDTGETYDREITDILKSELETFSDTFECAAEVCTSWFERATNSKFHQVHNHGSMGFSAVLFIQFSPEYHTPTVFLNPNLADSEICNCVPPGIREGSLIFFPSYVLHYTAPNESEKDRIVLSFNMNVEYESFSFADDDDSDGEYFTQDV